MSKSLKMSEPSVKSREDKKPESSKQGDQWDGIIREGEESFFEDEMGGGNLDEPRKK